jgi:hypothetical protein
MYGNKADMVLVYDQGPTQVRAALNHNKNFQSGSFSQSQRREAKSGSV